MNRRIMLSRAVASWRSAIVRPLAAARRGIWHGKTAAAAAWAALNAREEKLLRKNMAGITRLLRMLRLRIAAPWRAPRCCACAAMPGKTQRISVT
jgi:hypothetical protein